ncbi:P-loop containing nucleoside triphosphate hydrolase protein [Pelagophyceae sp. CCMP2097]|nr:P-loop containing nucleoside triphosphate hydrolase protein [Pelagophyceae sp. CCMP2097]
MEAAPEALPAAPREAPDLEALEEDAASEARLLEMLASEGFGADARALIEHFEAGAAAAAEYALPAALSKHGRHACHAWAEARGLASESAGAEGARVLTVRVAPPRDVSNWCRATQRALEAERAAEHAELDDALRSSSAACVARGVSIVGLRIAESDASGPGGRARLVLRPAHGGSLTAHRLDVRSQVRLAAKGRPDECIVAVVSRATPTEIEILSDCAVHEAEGLGSPLRLDAQANDATHAAMKLAAKRVEDLARGALRDDDRGEATALRAALLGRAPPVPPLPGADDDDDFVDDSLDAAQKRAVRFARSATLALVHGPPGTGKTTTLVELIVQCALRGERVLACAPSNVAVDNMLERVARRAEELEKGSSRKRVKGLKRRTISVVRLGHPSRLSAVALRHSLEAKLKNADGVEVVQDARDELRRHEKAAALAGKDHARRKSARRDAQAVRGELRARESALVSALLRGTNVVFCTNVGANSRLLDDVEKHQGKFDLVVVDEAAMALEVACWIPLLRGRRACLAGDHKQLAPTIKVGDAASKKVLEATIFERLIEDRRPVWRDVAILLDTQYRMHGDICGWASKASYGGRLVSANVCVARDVAALGLPKGGAAAPPPMVVIDHAGCGYDDDGDAKDGKEHGAASIANAQEAAVVVQHVESLLACGLRPQQICVIAPYNAQVAELRVRLEPLGVDARTVDGYQGGERDAVVLSLTRSNAQKCVGFLGENRRLNVAVTRARRHVAIICDSETVRSDKFIAALLDHAERVGEYRSVLESAPEPATQPKPKAAAAAKPAAPPPMPAAHVSTDVAEEAAAVEPRDDEHVPALLQRVVDEAPAADGDATTATAVNAVDPPARREGDSEDKGVRQGGRFDVQDDDASSESESESSSDEDQVYIPITIALGGNTHEISVSLDSSVAKLRRAIGAATGVEPKRQRLVFGSGCFGEPTQRLGAAAPQLKRGSRVMVLVVAPPPQARKPLSKNARKKERRKERTDAQAVDAPAAAPLSPPPVNDWLADLAAQRAARARVAGPPPSAAKPAPAKKAPKKSKKAKEDSDDDALLDRVVLERQKAEKADPSHIWKRWVDADGVLHAGPPKDHERDKLAKALQAKVGAKQHKAKEAKKKK